MATTDEHTVNEAAYRRMKDQIDREYEKGVYVALAAGRIVGDNDDILELHAQMTEAGYHTPDVMVVQAGVERLESAFILLQQASQ